ncbi:radical SAM protein [Desulfoplanes sp.]
MDSKYIFGPVPSGRLGRSLGLDLLGRAICDFDCVYCEVGRTEVHTTRRTPWVKASAILEELEQWLGQTTVRPEYITLGGKGEPCLNSELGAVIDGVHRIAPEIPVAVLTNGSLFGDPEVCRALDRAQVVLPSMDTLVTDEFKELNRPCRSLDLQTLANGMDRWAKTFSGKIFLEILLVAGINDTQRNLDRMRDFCRQLAPSRVDVVTMTRPGAYSGARPVDQATLAHWRSILCPDRCDGPLATPISPAAGTTMDPKQLEKAIMNSIAIRPQTTAQIALAMGVDTPLVQAAVERLRTSGEIVEIKDSGTVFHVLAHRDRA